MLESAEIQFTSREFSIVPFTGQEHGHSAIPNDRHELFPFDNYEISRVYFDTAVKVAGF